MSFINFKRENLFQKMKINDFLMITYLKSAYLCIGFESKLIV